MEGKYVDIEEALNEISKHVNFIKFEQTKDPLSDIALLEQLRKDFESVDRRDLSEVVAWEIQVNHLMIRLKQKGGKSIMTLSPMFEGSDREGKPWISPDLTKFHKKMLDYFKIRLYRTPNPLLKAKFADILWQKERDPKAAQEAVESYLKSAEQFFDSDGYFEFRHYFGRSICIAIEINSADLLNKLYERSKFFLEELESKKEYRWIIDVLNDLLNIPRQKIKIDYDLILKVAERGYRWSNPEKATTDAFIVDFLKIMERVYRKQGDSSKAKECRLREAISYEKIGLNALKNNQYLKASHFLITSLQKYISLGDQAWKVNELKQLIKDCNLRAQEHEFKTIKTEFKIPKEEIEKLLEFLKKKNTNEILSYIALNRGFLCSLEEARDQAKQIVENSPLQHMINASVQDSKGNILETLDTPDKKLKKDIYDIFDFHYNLMAKYYLIPIFELLKVEKSITSLDLKNFFVKFDFFDDNTLPFLEHGFGRYLENDNVSSIHILTFQIESILRIVLARIGAPTISTRDGKTQEKNLEGILLEEKIRSALGEDLVTFLEWFLIDKLGFNLRHKVAHALMEYKYFNEIWNILLIYILLLFTRFSYKKEQKELQ